MAKFIFFLMLVPLLAFSQSPQTEAQKTFALPACTKKVDASNVILFVDLNASYQEIEAAARAACERGQGFLSYPGYNISKNAGIFAQPKRKLELQYRDACPFTWQEKEECIDLKEKIDVLKEKLNNYLAENLSKYDYDAYIDELSKQGVTVTSLVMSGHSGGEVISGELGAINIKKIGFTFNKYYPVEKLPTELYFWGCYTVSMEAVDTGLAYFPNTAILAGYSGRGAANYQAPSSTYLENILIRTNAIISEEDEKELKKLIEKTPGVLETFSGVYVRTCSDMQKIYYTENPEDKSDKHFDDFNANVCTGIKTRIEFENKQALAEAYFSGAKETPEDTSSGELRELYSFSRLWAHCIQLYSLVPDRLGLLLFFKDVKNNFSHIFSDEIKQADDLVKSLSEEKIPYDLQNDLDEASSNLADKQKFIDGFEDYKNAKIEELHTAEGFDSLNSKAHLLSTSFPKGLSEKVQAALSTGNRQALLDSLNISRSAKVKDFFDTLDQIKAVETKEAKLSASLKSQLSAAVESKTKYQSDVTKYEDEIRAYKVKISMLKKSYQSLSADNIKNMSRKQIIELENNLSSALLPRNVRESAMKQFEPLKKLHSLAKNYLIDLNMDCMDFLWHEYNPARMPEAKCKP